MNDGLLIVEDQLLSSKKPPVGPSGSSVANLMAMAAPSAGVRVPLKLLKSVATCPGEAAFTIMPLPESSRGDALARRFSQSASGQRVVSRSGEPVSSALLRLESMRGQPPATSAISFDEPLLILCERVTMVAVPIAAKSKVTRE